MIGLAIAILGVLLVTASPVIGEIWGSGSDGEAMTSFCGCLGVAMVAGGFVLTAVLSWVYR